MKKIIMINVLALFACSSAFALSTKSIDFTNTGLTLWAAKGTNSGGTNATVTAGVPAAGTVSVGKTSTKVDAGFLVGGGGLGYAIITQHQQGTKLFGTSYDSTSIYQNDTTPGATTHSAAPTATDSSSFGASNGWTTM